MKRIFNPGLFYVFLALSLGIVLLMSGGGRDGKLARRVILIGIDGMGVSGFQQAATPNLDSLLRHGALSLTTRGVMPTVSGPNWGSHLLGAGPEQHGITDNGWTSDFHSIEPVVADKDGYFPSVFSLIREQRPDAVTGLFYDWSSLANFFNTGLITQAELTDRYEATFKEAAQWIIGNQPLFTFIYAGHPDKIGHAHGWGTAAYVRALEDVDREVGEFFKDLKKEGLLEETHVLVVSDHGGVGHGHGGLSMEELLTPWIIAGPGIIRNKMIEQPNNVANTAATIAYLLDLEAPEAWTGKPVLGAFENSAPARSNRRSFVHRPIPSISGGLFDESQAITLAVSDPAVTIRFTVDGSDPTPQSPAYKRPVLLQKSTTLKAAGSLDGMMSEVVRVDFTKVLKVRSAELSEPPDVQYPGEGSSTLVDRQKGSNQFKDGRWLGFSGIDLEALITLDERSSLSRCSVGIFNDPGSWIFPPEKIEVLASVDGKSFVALGSYEQNESGKDLRRGRNQLTVPITPAQVKYLKVIVRNRGVCPPDHPAAGEPAWLFVDEIILE